MVKQEIIIVNSKKFEIFEKISLVLHIITLIISFLTLISIIETVGNTTFYIFDKILEVITILFVATIFFSFI